MPLINLKQTLKNFKGETFKYKEAEDGPETDMTVGKVLANIILVPQQQKDGFRTLKIYELAKKFYEKDELDLDRSDFIQVKERVENSTAYSVMITGQILELFEEANDKKIKKEDK